MSIADPRVPEPAERISHEGALLALLQDAVTDLGVECVTGQGAVDRLHAEDHGESGTVAERLARLEREVFRRPA